MYRDHRPYFVRKAILRIEEIYTRHFLRPQFKFLGRGFSFVKPWYVEVFGGPVSLGHYANVIASSDAKVRLAVWTDQKEQNGIQIGDYSLICPGVRIGAAKSITLGNSCMIANGAYITDSDWHDAYNRVVMGEPAPVTIKDNVWIGDHATICKGVVIGENSIIGAGAVVTENIPANTIAAGNPAKIVKRLDPDTTIKTRAEWYANPTQLFQTIDREAKHILKRNSVLHWLRFMLFPKRGD